MEPSTDFNESTTNGSKQSIFQGRVQFGGQAGEFFGIWSVNILLSILTLGIYSAWAKVRTYRYFYSNTRIDGHSFDYLATPIQILKGRILAIIAFIIYSLVVQFLPVIGLLFALGFLFSMPWIINQGLRFNLRMTRHRNVRFAFAGNYGDALVNFVLLPIASVFTFYLLLPYALKRIDQYLHENISYGNKPINVNLKGATYYMAALITIGVAIGGLVIFSIFAGLGGVAINLTSFDTDNFNISTLIIPLLIAALYVAFLTIVRAVYVSIIRNHIFDSSEFEDVASFKSDLKPVEYAVLLFTNALAIIFTLGLAYPWAKIRRARLLAMATEVTIYEGALAIIDTVEEQQSSFAEEAANVFDIDISLT
ncbi:YjgN family protein [Pseudoalteromonas shioyasakiensis]|uniref:YjgN family protein n=1 Tax=Pseudoalteromonas shioyasakiensis TaxID=1190813 RepID=UPI002117EEC6|nr:YjgN family protein [Pseudoalteromonas shioyasakiensis]MCQ8877692.1 YjgN family protein [Pseudoalteromonas shioyasakiensis]